MVNPMLALFITFLLFVLGWWLFRPGLGQFRQWQRLRRLTRRVLREDALKHLYGCEQRGQTPSLASLAGVLQIDQAEVTDLVAEMVALKLIEVQGDSFHLTTEGRRVALHVIRAHRLYERYLADKTGYGEAEWHQRADWAEHDLTPAGLTALAWQLDNPTHDPHGDPIPTAGGEVVTHGGQPLTSAPCDVPLRIVHLEDEPEVVYAQLIAEGLYPGQSARLLAKSPERLRFWANGDEHVLAPVLAANISVLPVVNGGVKEPEGTSRLADLPMGESATVASLSPALRGMERRRLLDLGLLPGTQVIAELKSPGGDPTAYRIRGALVALRREQANLIKVTNVEATPDE